MIEPMRVLADAEVQDPAVRAAGELLGLVLGRDERRLALRSSCCCVSARSAEPPHSSGSTGASASSTSPDALRVAIPFGSGSKLGSASSQPSGSVRAAQPVEQLPALRVGRGPGVEPRLPLRVRGPAARRRTSRACASTSGVDVEGLLRVEAEDLLGRRDLVGAERRAVRLAGVLLVRRRPADDRAQRDERRPVGLRLGRLERGLQRGHVLDVGPVRARASRPSGRASRRPRSAARRPRSARCWCRPRWRSGCRRRSP